MVGKEWRFQIGQISKIIQLYILYIILVASIVLSLKIGITVQTCMYTTTYRHFRGGGGGAVALGGKS